MGRAFGKQDKNLYRKGKADNPRAPANPHTREHEVSTQGIIQMEGCRISYPYSNLLPFTLISASGNRRNEGNG